MVDVDMEVNDSRFERNRFIPIAVACVILMLAILLPTAPGLSRHGQIMLGILAMAVLLWATEPVPLAVTGLLVMIFQPILGILSYKEVFQAFGNQAVYFLIGAFMLAAAIEKHGLHKRLALRFVSSFGHSPKRFILGIMLCGALLSFIMPEHAVAALLLPIIMCILAGMKLVPRESNFGKASIIAIAYGCSIGSLGTLMGGARNPLTIGYLQEVGVNLTFLGWIMLALPIVLISLPCVWLLLIALFPPEQLDLHKAKYLVEKEVRAMGHMDNDEMAVLAILFITIILWIALPHTIGLGTIAILGGVLLFFTRSIDWRDVERRVPWGIIMVYGGAISMGLSLQSTGAAAWLVNNILTFTGENPYVIILVLIVLTISITNLMSNIGAVAMLLPIGLGLAHQVPELSPLLTSLVIALSGGCAFILVIATPGNAITYTSGYYSPKDLLKCGAIATLVCITIMFLIASIYWRYLGVW